MIQTQICKFWLGDRVKREEDVFHPNSPYKYGTISNVYARKSNFVYDEGPIIYEELYSVLWDDGTEENGFLPHGLENE